MRILRKPSDHDSERPGVNFSPNETQSNRISSVPWRIFISWAIAAVFGALTATLIFFIWKNVSIVRSIPEVGNPGCASNYLPWTLTDYRLQGAALSFSSATALIYWGVGLLLCVRYRRFAFSLDVRTAVSNAFFTLSVALVLFVVPMLTGIWVLALKMDAIPDIAWRIVDGNHGPWRRIPDLRYLLNAVFELPIFGGCAALVAMVFRFRMRAVLAANFSFMMFIGLLFTHYRLVD